MTSLAGAPKTATRVVLLAALLAFCAAGAKTAEAGPPGERSIRLSLKISKAKQRAREHAFYKSVARQGKVRTVIGRGPPSGR